MAISDASSVDAPTVRMPPVGPGRAAERQVIEQQRQERRVRTSGASRAKRRDLQGLRALAVVLVILDHLGTWPHGGFIGVDVFFVLSGYLITGVLLRSAHGGASVGKFFLQFYERRARRILPAALVALAAIWIAANLVYRGPRVDQTHTDALWALAFLANFHFADIGTNYFASHVPPSPVQHFWSLAVEEQFYLVWPVILLVMAVAFGRGRLRSATALWVALLVITVASFAWAVHATHENVTTAYFSTPVRAWELALGALVAVTIARFPGLAALGRWRGPVQLLAVGGIIASAAFIRSDGNFPAPASLAPVLATGVAVFAGASGPPGWWGLPLTNPVSHYIGDISYSLYLWHWPVIVYATALMPQRNWHYYAIVLCVMVGASVLSFHFIESPVHERGPLLRRVGGRAIALSAAIGGVALVVGGVAIYHERPLIGSAVSQNQVDASAKGNGSVAPPRAADEAAVSAALSAQINSSLTATAFPSFVPGLDKLGLTGAENDIWKKCDTSSEIVETCVFRPAGAAPHSRGAKRVLVTGDSISLSWVIAVERALTPRGWTVYGYAEGQCPSARVTLTASLGVQRQQRCTAHQNGLAQVLKHVGPSLVVTGNAEDTLRELASGAKGAAAGAEYRAGMTKVLDQLVAPGRKVVVLSPPPVTGDLTTCDTAAAVPVNCVRQVSGNWTTLSAADKAAAATAGARYVDTRLWFCNGTNYCPAFVGRTPVSYDGTHMTAAYAAVIAPELRTVLTSNS